MLGMNNAQITLVKESWDKVAPIAPAAATLFYDRLFAVAPGVRPLFPDDITEQKRKLIKMLGTIVDGLSDGDAVIHQARALGTRHARYGAIPEHYRVVGACLLWTLKQGLGHDFTPAVREAWTAAYGTVASVMIEAQGSADTQRSRSAA
jgi:hemoglobin-like flavoprotein